MNRLAFVLPGVEEVEVQRDGEEDVFGLAGLASLVVFAPECSFDLAEHRAAGERVLGADDDQFVVDADAAVDLAPDRFAPLGVFREVPASHALGLQVRVQLYVINVAT